MPSLGGLITPPTSETMAIVLFWQKKKRKVTAGKYLASVIYTYVIDYLFLKHKSVLLIHYFPNYGLHMHI